MTIIEKILMWFGFLVVASFLIALIVTLLAAAWYRASGWRAVYKETKGTDEWRRFLKFRKYEEEKKKKIISELSGVPTKEAKIKWE